MICEYQVHFVDFVVELRPHGVGDKVLDEVWGEASLGGREQLQVAEVGAARGETVWTELLVRKALATQLLEVSYSAFFIAKLSPKFQDTTRFSPGRWRACCSHS